MIFNKDWLIEKYSAAGDIPFCFFWGHQASEDGTITKSCLSQWWAAPFDVEGVVYQTAEHWMMAGKAALFGDAAALEIILRSETPADVKKAGRLIRNFDPVLWDAHKFDIVVAGNLYKFTSHPGLSAFLLSTGDQVLVEASPVDNIWGIGMEAGNPAAKDPAMWPGENLLGFALMEVREKIRVK